MPTPDEVRAADPATPPEELARIAATVPALRAVVADNPAAYPGLRQWIAEQAAAAAAPGTATEAATEAAAAETAPAPGPEPEPEPEPEPAEAPAPDPAPGPAPDRATGAEAASPRPRRRRAVALVAAASVLALLAAAAGGAVLGWTALAEIEARRVSDDPTLSATIAALDAVGTSAVVMPDVRGLTEEAAREVLADSGITPALVTASTRPAAGPAGTVIEQTPAFGSEDPSAVTLVVSTEATVPEVAGQDSADVVAALGELGTEVTIVQQYVAGASAGAVQSIDPAPGSALPEAVTLVVAEPAASVYLSTLDAVDGGCSTGSTGLDGTAYDNALSCRAEQEPTEVSWVASRVVDSLVATVGVPDDGDPTSRVRVEVLADGVLVASVEAGYGEVAPLQATVTGALRLTVRSTLISATDDSWASGYAVLGDARLVGGADAMTSLGVEP